MRAVLSIVIPTYNTAALTQRCVRAALVAAPDAEIVVVDDASTDHTASQLSTEPRIHYLRREKNGGFAAAANDGVNAAKGEVILLLNSDAILDRAAPRHLLTAFASNPHLGVASPQLFDEDGTPQWTGGRKPTLPWIIGAVSGKGHWLRRVRRRSERQATVQDWVSGAAMALRRKVWEDAGPLREEYRFYCQDIDFCLDARAHGWTIAVVPEARVIHARGATVGRARTSRLLREDLLLFGRRRYGKLWFWFARVVLFFVPPASSRS
jgi:GT2 family glycosyltransferase